MKTLAWPQRSPSPMRLDTREKHFLCSRSSSFFSLSFPHPCSLISWFGLLTAQLVAKLSAVASTLTVARILAVAEIVVVTEIPAVARFLAVARPFGVDKTLAAARNPLVAGTPTVLESSGCC